MSQQEWIPQASQDLDEFVSSSEKICRNLETADKHIIIIHKYATWLQFIY